MTGRSASGVRRAIGGRTGTGRGGGFGWIAIFLLLPVFPAPAQSVDEPAPVPPVEVARRMVHTFCQADAYGERLHPPGDARLRAVTGWAVEPAWDEVVLISGYEIGEPRDGRVAVDYSVVGYVSGMAVDLRTQLEHATVKIGAGENGWRFEGPPIPPHVFASHVDVPSLRAWLRGERGGYLSNSAFVRQAMEAAGWAVGNVSVRLLLESPSYAGVEEPKAGDLVVYSNESEGPAEPYHVAILDSGETAVSATSNAGILRAPLDFFPGARRFVRLTVAARPPATEEESAE